MGASVTEIQDQHCSSYDSSKLCSFDVEFIDSPTKPLIHQASRFLYFFKGAGTIKIGGAAYGIKPNTLVAIMPWETSEITEVREPLQFYKIIYDVELVSRAMRFNFNFDNESFSFLTTIEERPVAQISDAEAEEFKAIMLGLKNELGIDSVFDTPQNKTLSNILIVSKLTELVIRYLRIVSQTGAVQPEEGSGSSAADNCGQIFKYLYSHLSEHLTLEKVAAVVYMSESGVSKAVAETTGLSFGDLLSEMRVSKAINILVHTDMTLNEVAKLCGFTDASHLSKVFASRTGSTANEYRKINRRVENIFQDIEKSMGFEVIAFVEQNYNDPDLTIQTVIARFGLTAQETNKLFLLHLEKNFETALHSFRINRACEYLLTTDMSILDIAIEVGYSNVKTFNRNFAKLKNMTPGSFRKIMTLQVGDETIIR